MKNPTYIIQEIFNSIQGEGIDTGLPVCFVRFWGCNLRCKFCDTPQKDSRIKIELFDLLKLIVNIAAKDNIKRIILTGGEPTLQPIELLLSYLNNDFGYNIGVETNGTRKINEYLFGSISFSPKCRRERIKLHRCDSLKILYPYIGKGISAESYEDFPAKYKSLQPVDVGDKFKNNYNTMLAIKKVKELGDDWKVGIQLHKLINVK